MSRAAENDGPPQDSVQAVVDALSVALRRPVLLDDPALVPLAYSRQWGEIDAVRSDSILSRGASEEVRRALERAGIATADQIVETSSDDALGMARRLCLPLRDGGQLLAFIWLLETSAALSDEELRRVRAAGDRIVELLVRSSRRVVPDRTDLLTGLCSASSAERADAEADAYGSALFPRGPFVMCVVEPREPQLDAGALMATVSRRMSQGHVLVGALGGGAALVVALSDPVLAPLPADSIAEWLHTVAKAEISVGQSAVLQRLAELPTARRQAEIAVRAAAARNTAAAHAAWAALGADRLVAQLPSEARADVPVGLARLLREEPELTLTLRTFLDAAGDVRSVSSSLALHRSGLYYRLRRIEEISGLNLSDGGDRLLAHLAVRLDALRADAAQMF